MQNSSIPKDNRIHFIDVARGIGIISIILGHADISCISRVVYTYSIPLFFLITGYFWDEKSSTLQFIKRKFRTLIIPYAITGLAIILTGILIGIFKNDIKTPLAIWPYAVLYGSGSTWLEPFYIKGIGPVWFLLATFIGCVLLKLLQKSSLPFRIIAIASAFIFGCLTSRYLYFPFSIQSGLCSAMFIYLGYVFRREKHLFSQMGQEFKAVGLVTAVAIWVSFILRFKTFWIVNCDFGNGVADIFSSVCACICILAISFFVDRYMGVFAKFLSFIGKNSLFILCVHAIDMDLFQRGVFLPLLAMLSDNTKVIVLCLGELILDITLGLALSKIKAIRKVFGMKT